MNAISRPAFGQRSSLGAFYDARRDVFLMENLLTNDIPDDLINVTNIGERQTKMITSDSIKEQLAKLDVNDELTASFLTGIIHPQGSGRYLTQKRFTLPNVHRALVSTMTTLQETLTFGHPNIRHCLDFGALQQSGATHVVTEVTWGSRTIVSATHQFVDESARVGYESSLDKIFKKFNGSGGSVLEDPFADNTGFDAISSNGFGHEPPQVRVFSDIKNDNYDPPEDLEEALIYAKLLTKGVEEDSLAKSRPLSYKLLPVGSLVMLGAMVPAESLAGQLSKECLEKYVQLIDDFFTAGQNLNAYYQKLRSARLGAKPGHMNEVANKLRAMSSAETDLKARCAKALESIRAGHSQSQVIWQILEDFKSGDAAPGDLLEETAKNRNKLDFVSAAVSDGAELITDSGLQLHEAFRRRAPGEGNTYIFYFNDAVMSRNDKTWDDNEGLLRDLLMNERPRGSPVYIVDCDAAGIQLDDCRIEAYCDESLVTQDVLGQRRALADKHILRFDRRYLEPTSEIASKRRMFKIPCPGRNCDPNDACQWVCGKCHNNIEYGVDNGYGYCDCGRFPAESAEFNCQRLHHGPSFAAYPRHAMRNVVRNLPSPREVNILILGETGVGKSTFINAFVNYLTFPSLDEGLAADKLNWIIPCSFTTQRHDDTGRLVSTKVTIGGDKDERDGSRGQSATQKATVYPLYIGDVLIRLIDTPGIGDTRGLEQDAENLINVLSVLRNYPDLHGILILLKPNNARLGVMFRFCVKELLTQLHRSAAINMVFGFTNTRGSNYTPGDTFAPLEALLSEYRDAIPGLFRSNVYCFDSESFRYLAAKKQAGIDMGNIADYERSWEQSAKESNRLLEHFQTLRPHHTQQTLSLNETRHLISQLVLPMQQISSAITDTIANSEKQARELSGMQLTGKALEARLQIQKVVVNAEQLTQPKTVCANEACVETVVNAENNQRVTLRKNLCHNPCCLKDVPVGKVGTPELQRCYAFEGPTCKLCEHHWSEHEHILVEYSQRTQTVTDPEVRRQLETNGNVTKAKEAQIRALERQINELKAEHVLVQEAAAKFSLYLKSNSITHYNDATVEYLEHLIRDERTKCGAGAPRTALERLEKNLTNYKQFVATMEAGKHSNPNCQILNEAGVAQLVMKLYNLPHYGQQLKNMANVVQRAYEATFNEKPYRIRGRSYWMGTASGSNGGLGLGGFGSSSRSNSNSHFYQSSSFSGESSKFSMFSSGKKKQVVRSMVDIGEDANYTVSTTSSSSHMQSSSMQAHSRSRSVIQSMNPFKGRDRPLASSAGRSGSASNNWSTPRSNTWSEPSSAPIKSICDWQEDDPPATSTSKGGWFASNSNENEKASYKNTAFDDSPDDHGGFNGAGAHDFNGAGQSSSSAAPPRYDDLTFQRSMTTAPEVQIVEKKGVWVKLKTKLRKG